MASSPVKHTTRGERPTGRGVVGKWKISLRFHYAADRTKNRTHLALDQDEAIGVSEVWKEELLLRGYTNWTLRVYDPDGIRLWFHCVRYWTVFEELIHWRRRPGNRYPVDLLSELGAYKKSRDGSRKPVAT